MYMYLCLFLLNRFGHSLVKNNISMYSWKYDLELTTKFRDVFGETSIIHDQTKSVDGLLRGMTSDVAEDVDQFLSKELINHLFESTPPFSSDLAALNIQRGRDHGIPSYVKWRQFCKLSIPTDFTSLADMGTVAAASLLSVYE